MGCPDGRSGIVLVIIGYFDESGFHDSPDGKPSRLFIGGAVATEAAWLAVEQEWTSALNEAEISFLHMKEIAKTKIYQKGNALVTKFLNKLADIIVKNELSLIIVSFPIDFRMNKAVMKSHKNASFQALNFVASNFYLSNKQEELKIIFDSVDYFSEKHLTKLFIDIQKNIPIKGNVEMRRFGECIPLQIADFIVHQFSRWNGSDINPESPVFRFLKSNRLMHYISYRELSIEALSKQQIQNIEHKINQKIPKNQKIYSKAPP